MTNKYLEKIAKHIMPDQEDYNKHAPKAMMAQIGLLAGTAGTSIAASRLWNKKPALSKKLALTALGLYGGAVGTGVYSHIKTKNKLNKEYKIVKR